ncbi:MAG: tRNA pseudouridine(55) synthase TruB [Deltaproteobacteria bacterium]|nr:tRNA pseudouridine(55) synthase TruB [Deltaproteobacteria bacterium]MBP6831936.1 tRNA pseudouridine(55) synthase TruB [Deltaproteobacteria bacterium]
MPPRRPPIDGVLRVDKPRGPTSHDLVAAARRALGQREVGHAGTLDPMATGVLVLMLGEATKLSAHLSADDKAYEATVSFGAETDSLDADGEVVARAPEGTAAPTHKAIEHALAAMHGTISQVPPVVSAIKVDGEAMHARVRRGEVVVPEAREVVLREAVVTSVSADPAQCTLSLSVSKGFYVRSLARDLALALGTRGHLTALRRTRSGAFTLDGAFDGAALIAAARGDDAMRAAVRDAVEGWSDAGRWMPTVGVDEEAARSLRFGRPVIAPPGAAATCLVLDPSGAPVCVGGAVDGLLRVLRGISASAPSC